MINKHAIKHNISSAALLGSNTLTILWR